MATRNVSIRRQRWSLARWSCIRRSRIQAASMASGRPSWAIRWARLAVSIKNFISGMKRGKKNGRLITSHRSTTYSCCLPALGGFSRSWSCKTCRRKDKEAKLIRSVNTKNRIRKAKNWIILYNRMIKRSRLSKVFYPIITFLLKYLTVPYQ